MKKARKILMTAVFVLFAIGVHFSIAYSQQPSQNGQKESFIRATYGKLTFYNAAANAQNAAEKGTPYKAEDDLKFEIRNLHTGPIQEIYAKPMGQMFLKPSGDVISVGRAVYTVDGGPEHVLYRAKWVVSGYVGSLVEDWENTSIQRMLQLTGSNDVKEYTSYEVTVQLSGRARTYRAMALYHSSFQSAVEPTVDFLDNVVGLGALANALNEKLPPVKAPWFDYVKSDAYRVYVESQKKRISAPEKKNQQDEDD